MTSATLRLRLSRLLSLMPMWIAELWRYPVKSMRGEPLQSAHLSRNGIAGDREALVVRGNRIVTSRTHPRLLGHQGSYGEDGQPRVDGRRWDDPAVAAVVEEIAGAGARLIRYEGPERFDVLPLLVATDGAIERLGVDHRRLRPNIVIGGVAGLEERSWERRMLGVKGVRILLQDLRGRCVMTTYDPDTQIQDPGVLRRIAREFDGTFCLNASVVEEGVISVGDPVELLEDAAPTGVP
jgi:uncharacterized protein